MNIKSIKKLGITSIVFNSLATALALLGSILMFFDNEYDTVFSSIGYYDIFGNLTHYQIIYHHETCIMPIVGLIFSLTALLMMIVAYKKNWKVAKGTMVMNFVAQILLFACIKFMYHSDIAVAGYVMCCVAGGFMFIETYTSLGFIVCSSYSKAKSKESLSIDGVTVVSSEKFVEEYNNLRLLDKYKELLEKSIITEEEFEAKKTELLGIMQ